MATLCETQHPPQKKYKQRGGEPGANLSSLVSLVSHVHEPASQVDDGAPFLSLYVLSVGGMQAGVTCTSLHITY